MTKARKYAPEEFESGIADDRKLLAERGSFCFANVPENRERLREWVRITQQEKWCRVRVKGSMIYVEKTN